jgi:hypothetical protein
MAVRDPKFSTSSSTKTLVMLEIAGLRPGAERSRERLSQSEVWRALPAPEAGRVDELIDRKCDPMRTTADSTVTVTSRRPTAMTKLTRVPDRSSPTVGAIFQGAVRTRRDRGRRSAPRPRDRARQRDPFQATLVYDVRRRGTALFVAFERVAEADRYDARERRAARHPHPPHGRHAPVDRA